MLCRQRLVDDDSVTKLVADVVKAFRTVGYASLNHARPHRAGLVNQARVVGRASVAEDVLGRYPEPEVLVPTVAKDLLIARVRFDVGPVGEAQIAPIATSAEDLLHASLHLQELA